MNSNTKLFWWNSCRRIFFIMPKLGERLKEQIVWVLSIQKGWIKFSNRKVNLSWWIWPNFPPINWNKSDFNLISTNHFYDVYHHNLATWIKKIGSNDFITKQFSLSLNCSKSSNHRLYLMASPFIQLQLSAIAVIGSISSTNK